MTTNQIGRTLATQGKGSRWYVDFKTNPTTSMAESLEAEEALTHIGEHQRARQHYGKLFWMLEQMETTDPITGKTV
jgi:hypothetical protein